MVDEGGVPTDENRSLQLGYRVGILSIHTCFNIR